MKGLQEKSLLRCLPAVIAGFFVFFVTSCTTFNIDTNAPVGLLDNTKLIVGPIANYSDTPLANKQVESILLGLMHTKCFKNASIFPKKQACSKLLYCPEDVPLRDELIKWAKGARADYVLTGATNEWRYKVGLDGEPVAGVSLALIEVSSGKTVWSGVGSIIGGPRLGLDVVGQQMLEKLTKPIVAIPYSHTHKNMPKTSHKNQVRK